MFVRSTVIALALVLASARPLKREVPQEHSHERFLTSVKASLNLNNPDEIQDPVFALLGNAAAAAGAGKITNLDCLQQATADQAFTNAKAAGDVDGQINALIFRALERNTGRVGQASALCNEQAVNPEIAALQQHQDAASAGAQENNLAVEQELAVQIAALGGDPMLALLSGTFAPGDVNNNTGKGNSCDDLGDPEGCIFTRNLLTPAASAADIQAAVAGVAVAGTPTVNTGAAAAACPAAVTVTVLAGAGGAAANNVLVAPAAAAATPVAAAAAVGGNLQNFSGALGGITAPAVTAGGRGFEVENNSDFLNQGAAITRSCDVQHNQCANAANGGADFSVSDCDAQLNQCKASA